MKDEATNGQAVGSMFIPPVGGSSHPTPASSVQVNSSLTSVANSRLSLYYFNHDIVGSHYKY